MIPEKTNLKEGRFILSHGFRIFHPWTLGSIISRPVMRQNIIARHTAEQSCSLHGI
jgi:hypothetical protein